MNQDSKMVLRVIYQTLLQHHDTLVETSRAVAALSQAIAQSNAGLWNLYQSKLEELQRETAELDKKSRAPIVAMIDALTA